MDPAGLRVDLVQFVVGSGYRFRCGGCAWAPPYPPYIRAGYEGCRSAQTFEAHLRRSPGSIFCDRSVTGPSVRTFETGLGHLL